MAVSLAFTFGTLFMLSQWFEASYGWNEASANRLQLSLVVLVLGSIVAAATIYWFNVPKALVPPQMRSHPGRWQERKSKGSR